MPMNSHSYICPEQHGNGNGNSNDPYRYYVGQKGYNMEKCQSFDEINKQHYMCHLILKSTSPQIGGLTVIREGSDQYLSINDNLTEKIVSCQNITPSYYPNMTLDMIGKRPVYSTRNCEYQIPDIILKDADNLVDSKFTCVQPVWCHNCK